MVDSIGVKNELGNLANLVALSHQRDARTSSLRFTNLIFDFRRLIFEVFVPNFDYD